MTAFKDINCPNITMNTSSSKDLVNDISDEINKNMQEMNEITDEAYESYQEVQQAIKQTAGNASDSNNKLQKIIDQQSDYIDLLKKNYLKQELRLKTDEQQLDLLKDIFSVGSDSMTMEQEIEDFIQEQMGSDQQTKKFLKDKTGDFVVAGASAGIPIIWNAVKLFGNRKEY